MPLRVPPLSSLRFFEAAARHRSFKRAAAELNVTPSAVSHGIVALEQALGVELFVREPRGLSLTPEGDLYLPYRDKNMKSALLSFVAVMTVCLSNAPAGVPTGWKTHRGNYFSIGVPPGFVATPQGESGDGGRSDAVSLWNQKLAVEFYVFSPIWNGNVIIKEVAERAEELTSHESKKTGGILEEQWTITARNKSYVRFVVSRTDVEKNINTTFGIRVPNMKAYESIRPIYLQWKATLEKYGD